MPYKHNVINGSNSDKIFGYYIIQNSEYQTENNSLEKYTW